MLKWEGRVIRKLVAHLRKRLDPIGYARSIGVKVGNGCRLINVSFSTEPYLIRLGNRVSATACHFETHDGGVWVLREKMGDVDVIKTIEVGDNVFIGYGSVILPGVRIGSNVVIGAHSVVARDIPSNCVAVGVPARPIKTIDAYQAKVAELAHFTKGMPPGEKRAYYESIFGSDK